MTPLLLALAIAQPPQFPVLPPPGRVQPVPVPAQPAVVTLDDFSRLFTPLPGKHRVWFVHPCSGQPVEVCFTLPPGRLKRLEVEDREIEFHINKCEVRIEFRRNGTVKVEYDD